MDADGVFDRLLREKDGTISRLDAEIEALRRRERQLWGAVAHLRFAVGAATAWRHSGEIGGEAGFDESVGEADDLLDGVIGLVPADNGTAGER